MFTYETVFITIPNLTDEEEQAAVAGLTQVVAEGGGVLVTNDRMGRRRMAYPIKKFEDGIYTRFLYDALPAVPKELERRLRISDKVLRHMTVRLEPDWAVAAKEQAVRDEKARAEAEAARAAGIPEEAIAESIAPPKEEGRRRGRDEGDRDDVPDFGDDE